MIKHTRIEDRDQTQPIDRPYPAWVTATDAATGTQVRILASPEDQAKAQSFATKYVEILIETFGDEPASHIENLREK